MTTEFASIPTLKKQLIPRGDFHPFPKYEERNFWDDLPQATKEYYLAKAEEVANFDIPNLNATDYMNVARINSGAPYEGMAGHRRTMLVYTLMLECIEGKGTYIDKIIDLVWAICEESTWIGPRHNNHMHNHMLSGIIKNALPDVTDFNFIDLWAGTTTSVLTWVYYMLKDRLDEESPLICKRIELEVMKRIVIPFVNHDDMTWCGFYGHKINNWNPWILGNNMPAFMVVVKDPDLQAELIARAMEKLDIYINECKPDGGCDEGPGYWGAAGAALYDCLEELYVFTDGKLNLFENNDLMKNIGEYIVKANVRGNEFVNFADNGHRISMDGGMLYHFAEYVGSDRLKAFASNRINQEGLLVNTAGHMFRELRVFIDWKRLSEVVPMKEIPQDDWLADTELLYVRDKNNQLTAAAKGGFNNESHNHNDLGHFICSYEGNQFLVDLGSLPYTPKTFSPFRYEIWILQSAWHNCAAINGFDQHDGDDYKAKILDCRMGEDKVALSMELKGAYETGAGIASYVRSFEMDKEKAVWTVADTIALEKGSDAVDLHFVTVKEPKMGDGSVEIPVDDSHVAILTFDGANWTASVDSHDLESAGLKKGWESECAYRIHLTPKSAAKEHTSTVTVQVVEK